MTPIVACLLAPIVLILIAIILIAVRAVLPRDRERTVTKDVTMKPYDKTEQEIGIIAYRKDGTIEHWGKGGLLYVEIPPKKHADRDTAGTALWGRGGEHV